MKTAQLSGTLKVAVLIHAMGEKTSNQILNQMQESEKQLVKKHLSQIESIAPEVVEKIVQEFKDIFTNVKKNQSNQFPIGPIENEAKLKDTKGGQGTPAEQKQTESEQIEEDTSLKALQSIEPDQLVEMIKDEHPQTIAVIIVHLKPEVGSFVLAGLPDNLKVEVAMRIARLDKVLSGMIIEINGVFEEILKKKKSSATYKKGGITHLAELLNMADGSAGELILSDIEEVNPDLAAQIKQMMFVFEDLILVNDKGLQKVLRKVDTQKLSLALKGASEEVKKKIFKNMSERASVMLKEEIEAIGAVRMKDVEEAQQSITKIIQELEAKNELVISGRKGGDFIA